MSRCSISRHYRKTDSIEISFVIDALRFISLTVALEDGTGGFLCEELHEVVSDALVVGSGNVRFGGEEDGTLGVSLSHRVGVARQKGAVPEPEETGDLPGGEDVAGGVREAWHHAGPLSGIGGDLGGGRIENASREDVVAESRRSGRQRHVPSSLQKRVAGHVVVVDGNRGRPRPEGHGSPCCLREGGSLRGAEKVLGAGRGTDEGGGCRAAGIGEGRRRDQLTVHDVGASADLSYDTSVLLHLPVFDNRNRKLGGSSIVGHASALEGAGSGAAGHKGSHQKEFRGESHGF